MTLTLQTDQVSQAVALLLSQFRGKPGIEALLSAFVKQLQEVENTLFDLLSLRSLALATGAQLDGLGRIININRDGRNDADYREALITGVLINTTRTTIPEIVTIVKDLIADTYFVTVNACNTNGAAGSPIGPADVYIDVGRNIGDTPTPLVVAKLLRRFVAGGVRAVIAWDDMSAGAGASAFSLGPSADSDGNSIGLGNGAGTTGGMFIRASDGETPESME